MFWRCVRAALRVGIGGGCEQRDDGTVDRVAATIACRENKSRLLDCCVSRWRSMVVGLCAAAAFDPLRRKLRSAGVPFLAPERYPSRAAQTRLGFGLRAISNKCDACFFAGMPSMQPSYAALEWCDAVAIKVMYRRFRLAICRTCLATKTASRRVDDSYNAGQTLEVMQGFCLVRSGCKQYSGWSGFLVCSENRWQYPAVVARWS
ncbi:hypothetical protein EJ03DRAFT_195734 [Teratosphaeria nubilosa]|uniref:Uncharacterized protein n=1 Tax=Teratosphaeria nubilosa TaxID=161662 RepID=A0A6G1KYW1_9PEZI|nr:hypothetical protein EJ03DRAFT_195734 [Teratosphaeria nubilosa]